MSQQIRDEHVEVEGLRLHYTTVGEGPPVILLHGWPTSSFLWRNVMPHLAAANRVIALDLPGFGGSDKPLDASYSFIFYERILEGFVEALGIDSTGLAVHDLGGPLGVFWVCRQPHRLDRLALLNTLIYPNPSWAVILFVLSTKLPVIRSYMASPRGLAFAMRLGIANKHKVTEEVLAGVQAPFASREARRALLAAGHGLSPKGFVEITKKLPALEVPVRIVYGEKDRILPDVAKTMARVQRDLPQTQATALPDCGHFLQEDQPDEIGRLLAPFFAGADA